MSEFPISYTARPDATPKAELGALASAYRFVLDCHAKKEAAAVSRPDDAERNLDDGARNSIQDPK
jgi:hypothetical protein